jgi:hypothetical protein
VCVQPWLEDRHYASAATFKQALAALLAQVERRSEPTTTETDDEDVCPLLVVFPEMVVLLSIPPRSHPWLLLTSHVLPLTDRWAPGSSPWTNCRQTSKVRPHIAAIGFGTGLGLCSHPTRR